MTMPLDDDSTRLPQRFASAARAGNAIAAVDMRDIGALAAMNPLVAAANPLLMTIPTLRSGGAPASVEGLRARLIELFGEFERACQRASIPEEQSNLARYALCTVLDETIQRTAWSHAANWPRQSLTVHFYKENLGGEAFFNILEKLQKSAQKFRSLLQLFYVCLSLGFMGKYLSRDATGRAEHAELRERLYTQYLRESSTEDSGALSPKWRGLAIESRQFQGFAPLWIAGGAIALFCLLLYSAFALKLAALRDDTGMSQLVIKSSPPVRTLPAPPPPKPRLAQLLKGEIDTRQIGLSETAAESVITLSSELAFESGSATPSAQALALLSRIGQALATIESQVGQVIVVGHTDNVPTRTLQFPSNFELSRARARNVADQLRAQLKNASRVRDEGRGDADPIDTAPTAEARARNRRVEITLRPHSP